MRSVIHIQQPQAVIPGRHFFFTVAFLAGFSERWTRVILDGAQSVIGVEREKPPVTDDHVPTPDVDKEPETPAATSGASSVGA